MRKKPVVVNDLMQKNYRYFLTEPAGQNFHHDFNPELTPKQMLELDVFGGKYMTDCKDEFPKDWFRKAKISHESHNPALNFFGVNASNSLSFWQKKGIVRHTSQIKANCRKFDLNCRRKHRQAVLHWAYDSRKM